VSSQSPRTIPNLRWWVGALLFASTVINYLDRQTLSVLAPYLKSDFHWSNKDYAFIIIGFRVAYSAGQTIFGRLMDRVGTRRGLTLTVLSYSLVSIFTPLANGLRSFVCFRFLLGAGESANWPAATKVVSEWFPKHQRGLATALFDSGSSVGGAIAPFLMLGIYFRWGWRPAFIVPGCLGLIWLAVWRWFYFTPDVHPRITQAERELLAADKGTGSTNATVRPSWRKLLALRQTWGVIVARTFTDPVWFFITDWFPIYLVAKGIDLRSGILAVWVPFVAADAGNFFGGWISGVLIKRGWSVGTARKAVVVGGGLGVLLLAPTIFTTNLVFITALFAVATFSYAAFSTMALVFPSDLFREESVATVSGMSGTGSGLGTIVAFYLIGYFSDARQSLLTHAFDPIIVVAAMIPAVGMLLVLWLVRNDGATRSGLVRTI
jgi:ACS family hexuronate transporter-like MFS transporter